MELISVKTKLPEDDKRVLIWADNVFNPKWSGFKLGACINGKFYLVGGYKTGELKFTHWVHLPEPPAEYKELVAKGEIEE